MPGGVLQIRSKKEYDLAIAQPCLTVVDFTASWCQPCQRIRPEFEAMADKAENASVQFISVDVDKNDDIATAEGVRAMPTLRLFDLIVLPLLVVSSLLLERRCSLQLRS